MHAAKWMMAGSTLAAALLGGAAQADVVISTRATANMNCSAGVCSPTGPKAVLNAADLTNMLAGGDLKVTTGSGATNIVVKEGFSWTATSRLTLDAIQSVEFDKPVTVAGTGAVTITTNDGGSGGDLLFGDKGNLTFWDLSSSLVISGNSYTLVGDIKTLASDIAASPSGFYALANDYDASVDGTYSSAPIATELEGSVEGLNHKIDQLKINASDAFVGLFTFSQGTLRDMAVTNATIDADGGNGGVLLAQADGATIVNCSTSGSLVFVSGPLAGGLAGAGNGFIARSHANVKISVGGAVKAGGLVGSSSFDISQSYSSGSVSGGDGSDVGGLVGVLRSDAGNRITQSYATGRVSAGDNSDVGGLVGQTYGNIDNAYATGSVKGGRASLVGGFGGQIVGGGISSSYATGHVRNGSSLGAGGFLGGIGGDFQLTSDYWDIDTTGKGRGAGCGGSNCGPGAKGLTTQEFQSGLPDGFDPNLWGEKKSINDGFPYLLSVPK